MREKQKHRMGRKGELGREAQGPRTVRLGRAFSIWVEAGGGLPWHGEVLTILVAEAQEAGRVWTAKSSPW